MNLTPANGVFSFSFVVVWDKHGSRRDDIPACDLTPPSFTFAGEIISGGANVCGNAFACIAESPTVVQELMKKSIYYDKVRFNGNP